MLIFHAKSILGQKTSRLSFFCVSTDFAHKINFMYIRIGGHRVEMHDEEGDSSKSDEEGFSPKRTSSRKIARRGVHCCDKLGGGLEKSAMTYVLLNNA